LASAATALFLFSVSYPGLCCDARGYYDGAQAIIRNGLLGYSDDLRTYGYPLFLAFTFQVAKLFSLDEKVVVFVGQWLVLLGISAHAKQFFYAISRNWFFAFLIFAGTMLNVFLLTYTSVLLTDLVSSVIAWCAVLLAVAIPRRHSAHHKSLTIIKSAFFSSLCAGIATMIRPANLSILGAVVFIWIIRALAFRDMNKRAVVSILLGLSLPFIPQVINNYRVWGVFQPLVIQNLYGSQLQWGLSYLKYSTLLSAEPSPQLFYLNPLFCGNSTSPIEFALSEPLNFLMTVGLHLFGLFDFDFLFPYNTIADPWYRIPLSVLNYTFLFLAGIGILRWGHRSIAKRRLNRIDLVFVGMLIATGSYLAPYLFVAVENRFSLPLYLLITPFFAYSIGGLMRWDANSRRFEAIVISVGLWSCVTLSLLLSKWISLQAPALSGKESTSCCIALEKPSDAYLAQIQLLGYSLAIEPGPAGLDQINLVVGWLELDNKANTMQGKIRLGDMKGHLWAQTDKQGHQFCTVSTWNPKPGKGASFILRLPPTMPAGQYQIILDFFDDLGNEIGNHIVLATVPIKKNKGSFTASQLFIEQPLFVDMNEMRFLGYTPIPDSLRRGETLAIGAYWRAREKPRSNYWVTVQVRDQADRVVLEHTSPPAEGTYPTIQWNAGEVLLDWHDLLLPENLAPGVYSIEISLNDPVSNTRLGQVSLPSILVTQ